MPATAAPDRFRLAVAQPPLIAEPDPEANVARAIDLIARAAPTGASLVLFPEGSPGPYRAQWSYDAMPAMAGAAARHGIAVCWSRMEAGEDGHFRLVVYLHDREGVQRLRYERSHPATLPPADTGSWVAPGKALCTVDLDGVRLGVVVCSELWVPEPARILALRGAEVLLSPAGGRFTTLTDNWQLLARARAIENHCHVALTANIHRGEAGPAMIAGPEHVLAASPTEELVVATCDLGRARWLRDRDDSIEDPKPFDAIPGLLRARRPELYGELAEPRTDVFDYTTPDAPAWVGGPPPAPTFPTPTAGVA